MAPVNPSHFLRRNLKTPGFVEQPDTESTKKLYEAFSSMPSGHAKQEIME